MMLLSLDLLMEVSLLKIPVNIFKAVKSWHLIFHIMKNRCLSSLWILYLDHIEDVNILVW